MSVDSILTCKSTGGPATNVTWTRGNDEDYLIPVLDNAQVTVLENATIAHYSHTLNVTGTDLSAVYGCSVSNNKPSSAKAITSTFNANKWLSMLKYSQMTLYYCP